MIFYTIGYERLVPNQFIKHLIYHEIDVVADVRKLPVSRKKGFSKTALKQSLRSQNIDYLNFQSLGASKELRDELYRSKDYSLFFRKYQESISDKGDHLKTIHALVNRGKKVALLCFERNPRECHRRVVAEEIKNLDGNGLIVKHIVPG